METEKLVGTRKKRRWLQEDGRAMRCGRKGEKMRIYRCRPLSRVLEKRPREKKLSGMEL